MKILIIKLSALGDVVHALPVLDYIRQVAPEAQVDWIVDTANAAVLDGNPLLSRVIPVPLRLWKKKLHLPSTWRQIAGETKRLRSARYDLSLDLQGNIKSGLVALLAGARRRYGFDRSGVRELPNLLAQHQHVTLRDGDHHVASRSLRVVSAALGRDYTGMELQTGIFTTAAHEAVVAPCVAAGDPLILFHTGTTWPTKRWHRDGWQRLAGMLLAQYPGARLLFSWGNPEERHEAEELAVSLDGRGTVLPKLGIKEFCALLKRVDLVVGGDTGPVHLAAAVGTASVSFYRATDPLRNGPKGERHRFVTAEMPCVRCLKRSCDQDEACRRAVSPEALLKAVRELLG